MAKTDLERIEAMTNMNWTPASSYWRTKFLDAQKKVDALTIKNVALEAQVKELESNKGEIL